MRFSADHHFDAPAAEVAGLLVDPDFYVALALPDLSLPTVLAHRPVSDAEGGLLRLRYEFTGSLDPIAQRLLGGGRLAWIQELRLSPAGESGSLHFGAEGDPSRLHGDATFALVAGDAPGEGAGTVRRLVGNLVVKVPVIGGPAERRIVPGLLGRLDQEAAGIAERLARRPG